MAFPGTYNINYYKGDTFEFNIYPKDSSGQAFDLTGYGVTFTIANARGANPDVSFSAQALIPTSADSIRCAILPSHALNMTSGNSYVYDVQISNNDEALPYPLVYTLLNGTITVTSDITGAV